MAKAMSKQGERSPRSYSTGHGDLVFGNRCLIMGILNATPDSFSDGGRHVGVDAGVARVIEMVREGADVIDVGGESTRPGSRPVPAGAQIDRTIPVIRGARATGVSVPISIDTQSAEVAAAALDAGADIVNDVSGARHLSNESGVAPDNTEMIQLLAERGVPFVLMHALAASATMQAAPAYDDVVRDVGAFFERRAAALEESGIATRERMIVDPGIGFGKTLEHNLALIRACATYSARWPVLLGTSRKRFIAEILAEAGDHPAIANAEARLMGTAASVAHAALSGVEMVRVHDVRAMRDVVDVCARLTWRRVSGSPAL